MNSHATVLTINLQHLTHNFTVLKGKLRKGVKLLAVVKASAYGNDSVAIAKHLETLDVDYFAVAYANEGILLREAGIKTPILVLHPQPLNFDSLIAYNLEPNLYSFQVLRSFLEISAKYTTTAYPIHFKFNTGLNRLGFEPSDIEEIISLIKSNSSVKVASLFSHLAASEDPNETAFTLNQIEVFKKISSLFINSLGYTPLLHQSNTSGILNYPEAHFSMVRTGIGLYGYGNDSKYNSLLKPIATLTSRISQIHTLEKGGSLGYNRAFIASKTTRTATIPIGHADGINRIYGHQRGFVFINNQKAFILGNVCMDMIMVDITSIPCTEGDEVIIFDDTHTAATVAENSGTISYELITSISKRVTRRFKK